MTNRRKAFMAIAAVLAVALVAAAIWLAVPEHSAKVYRDSMKRAELAFNEGDYEGAILAYQKAIERDETSVAAYEGLYESYMAMGDVENARRILEEGIQKTQSGWLIQLLANLDEADQADNGGVVSGGGEQKILSMNNALVKKLSSSSFGDYGRKDSPVSSDPQADGSVLVRFNEVPGTMNFRNSAQQASAVSNGRVSASALPEEVYLDDIDDLLGRTPCTMEELENLGISSLQRATDGQRQSVLRFEIAGCTVTVECDEDGTIQAGAETVIVPTQALALAASGGAGELTLAQGSVIDAQTGEPVEEITIRFFEDEDTSGDPLVDPVTTNSFGEYEVNLPPGTYIAELSGEGYITTTREVTIGEYEVESEADFVVTKDLAEGEARLVLEWGEQPQDLDSYIFGTTDSGSRFRLSRWDRSFTDGDVSMELDLDDMDGYGPETITIHGFSGYFEYVAFDYNVTGTMGQNGATATIYISGQQPVTVSLGSGSGVENEWNICVIDHGELKVVNEAGNRGSSYAPK